ncbi:two-component system sensor histidine kinase NtrB [Ancylobacter vacuolatus]|uniref:histidine kinase n=1 Tax=Ancylobacter vacuolatus TaxID=223389 RepID=A0ABU0DK59_9HYPH|nr:ATP-binding protein [Ancylobacter vacuolatus]MDQ0348794.1 PAS domain S-box-containing protein [Ancylobacter vacuolatus]
MAAPIFAVDTLTPLDTAIAVLYVAVIMPSAHFLGRRGVLAVSGGCIALTTISFLIVHQHDWDSSALVRLGVSLSAITITSLLTLRNQQVTSALREQANLLNLTHDAIFVRDMADRITYWNQGAEQLYGWSRAEALGQTAASLLRTRFPDTPASIQAALLADRQWAGELTHFKRDGTQVTVLSRWSLQMDKAGRPVAVMETNNDITERKRSEAMLQKAQTELAHATRVATMGELTASIAHEVNQPLAAVVTNGEACLRWLGREVPDLGEARASVERMISNGKRASHVVARLRALARRADPDHMPVNLNDVVEDALALVDREAASHSVSVGLTLDAALPDISGDRVQLQQVVINLLMNAIQAMAGVTGRARTLSIATRDGSGPDGERIATVEVRDTGIGIDPQSAEQLFTAFYSTKKEGLGMGLSICRSIIEAHGGRISFVANADHGMSFTVKLPALKELVP